MISQLDLMITMNRELVARNYHFSVSIYHGRRNSRVLTYLALQPFSCFPCEPERPTKRLATHICVTKEMEAVFTIAMTSLCAWWRLISPASRLFTQPFIQGQINESIKFRVTYWPLWGEFTCDRASAQRSVTWKCLHLMTSLGNAYMQFYPKIG